MRKDLLAIYLLACGLNAIGLSSHPCGLNGGTVGGIAGHIAGRMGSSITTCITSGITDNDPDRIPDDVFYLMPSFAQGTVFLRGQAPAQGQLNICAVDQTLRFIDENGTELAAADHDGILKVQIDTVTFLRHQNAFVRLHPVSTDMGVAVRRDVRIISGGKQAAYGGTSQTSSISEVGTLYTEGASHALKSSRGNQYKVSETILVYKRDAVFHPTRKNLTKLFPSRKAEIESHFKSFRTFPDTVPEAQKLLADWAQ